MDHATAFANRTMASELINITDKLAHLAARMKAQSTGSAVAHDRIAREIGEASKHAEHARSFLVAEACVMERAKGTK